MTLQGHKSETDLIVALGRFTSYLGNHLVRSLDLLGFWKTNIEVFEERQGDIAL